MCLYSKTSVPKVADEDIICYKVMTATSVEGEFMTPYKECAIGCNIINGEEPFVASGVKDIIEDHNCILSFVISGGFIHTFQHLEGAKHLCYVIANFWFKKEQPSIFICKIPKGTKYFTGIDDNYRSFASEQIVFQEKLA